MSPQLGPIENYLLAPQKQGLWTLTLDLRSTAYSGLVELLNLRDAVGYAWGAPRHLGESAAPQPVILPRLFAYLRAALPKKVSAELRPLLAESRFRRPGFARSRWQYFYREMLQPPANLSASKKRALGPAGKVFVQGQLHECVAEVAFDNASKLDFFSGRGTFFQVSESPGPRFSVVTVVAVQREPLEALRLVLQELAPGCDAELTKTFSPEETLLEAYLRPATLADRATMLRQRYLLRAVDQALDEAVEGRHVHAIRAIGIGTEELIVHIYETLFRDRAPAGPLGSLLQQLEGGLAVRLGAGESHTISFDAATLNPALGQIISDQAARSPADPNLLAFLKELQKSVFPALAALARHATRFEKRFPSEGKNRLFPKAIQRHVDELVDLRNRVSHRAERGQSVSNLTQIETAIALRGFLCLATWWEQERSQIDFTQPVDDVLVALIDRTRATDELSSRGG